MGKKSFKDRVVIAIKREQTALIRIQEPGMKDHKSPSLNGRVKVLPKNAFWQRVGLWPFVEEEKFVI
ncbi:MAG TPA: hypothetical protein VHK67_01410 [Rhabdochlamydiaceae bacterium]|jgi:hypothetical protein|nr:hypothetical protein [Rhabdochlamydiaceae bacterium]